MLQCIPEIGRDAVREEMPRLDRVLPDITVGQDGAEFAIDGEVRIVMPLRIYREFVERCRTALLTFEERQRNVVRLGSRRKKPSSTDHAA